jgi:hypothetical protein
MEIYGTDKCASFLRVETDKEKYLIALAKYFLSCLIFTGKTVKPTHKYWTSLKVFEMETLSALFRRQ